MKKTTIYILLILLCQYLNAQENQTLSPCLDTLLMKFGFVDSDFNFVIQPQYDFCYPFNGEVAWIQNIIPEPTEHSSKSKIHINDFNVNNWNYKEIENKNSIINRKGEVIYDDVSRVTQYPELGLTWFKHGESNKVVLINKNGIVISDKKYDWITFCNNGVMKVRIDNEDSTNMWGGINLKGKEIIKPNYKKLNCFEYKLNWLETNSSLILINNLGEILYESKKNSNDITNSFVVSDSLAILVKDSIYFINDKSEINTKDLYKYHFDKYNEKYFKFYVPYYDTDSTLTYKVGLINQDFKIILEANYKDIQRTSSLETHIAKTFNQFLESGFYKYILIRKNEFISDYLLEADFISKNHLRIKPYDKIYYWADTLGKVICNNAYLKTPWSIFSEGLSLMFNKNSKIGFINSTGETEIEYKYRPSKNIYYYGHAVEYRSIFSNGFCEIINDLWLRIYIDEKGNEYYR